MSRFLPVLTSCLCLFYAALFKFCELHTYISANTCTHNVWLSIWSTLWLKFLSRVLTIVLLAYDNGVCNAQQSRPFFVVYRRAMFAVQAEDRSQCGNLPAMSCWPRVGSTCWHRPERTNQKPNPHHLVRLVVWCVRLTPVLFRALRKRQFVLSLLLDVSADDCWLGWCDENPDHEFV